MTDEQLIELQEYADLEGGELCEALHHLLQVYAYGYCFSEEFHKLVADELSSTYNFFKKKSKIIEREVISKRFVKELVWEN